MKYKVDLLIKGGTILTMDWEGTMFNDAAVAIADDRIIEVGKRNILEKKLDPEKVINAEKKVIMPGSDRYLWTLWAWINRWFPSSS